jgi:murein L,D-transpeptidase YcbB/YkuD
MHWCFKFGVAVFAVVAVGPATAAQVSPRETPTNGSQLAAPIPPSRSTRPAALSDAPVDQPAAAGPSGTASASVQVIDAQPKPPASPVIAVSQDPRPSFGPDTFINTMRAAGIYKQIAESGGWPTLPAGTTVKMGDRGPAVTTLRQRLAAEGDLPSERISSPVFDSELMAAVKRFQARHGLPETGVVRSQTLEALNVPAATRHRQLAQSAQRLIVSTFAFGERYVVVNIPSATIEAIEGRQVVRRYVGVVGKADRPSPMVETRITAINLNPTWTIPVSLIRKDIIPHMRKDPGYLAKMKIRVLDPKGQEVDPQTIDWSTERAVNYTLRQDPGATNSLGQIRIDMPNRHAVYMHDTPMKRLFAQDVRFHSSGCVRVAAIRDLVEWLLQGTTGPAGAWTAQTIDAAIGSMVRQDIRLDRPVPVAWVYLTGYALADGTVHFRRDVYGLDAPAPDPVIEPQSADVPATASIPAKRG